MHALVCIIWELKCLLALFNSTNEWKFKKKEKRVNERKPLRIINLLIFVYDYSCTFGRGYNYNIIGNLNCCPYATFAIRNLLVQTDREIFGQYECIYLDC